MTVWSPSVVIQDEVLTASANAGPSAQFSPNGRLPVPPGGGAGNAEALGVYPISTLGGSLGGTIAGQGGAMSVY